MAIWSGSQFNTATNTSDQIRFLAGVIPQEGPTNGLSSLGFRYSINGSDSNYVWQFLPVTNALLISDGLIDISSSIGATSTDGFLARTFTNATAGVQSQYPRRLRFIGTTWDGAASQLIDFRLEVAPVPLIGVAADLIVNSRYGAGAVVPVVSMRSTGFSFFANPGSYGGGDKVIFIANAATVPTSNPVGGGIFYTSAGALLYRGSAGTVTPIAPA